MKFFMCILIFIQISTHATDENSIRVDLEHPNGTKETIELIDYIESGEKNIYGLNNNYIKDKAVMVMGLSGTGKSTLINYLNDIPLISLKRNGKWIVDLKDENVTLPGGFSIGHNVRSKTLYPSVFTPDNENFSYVDNPGFRDTRGIAIEIANGFFREQVTRNINELKFLLLVTHQDIEIRGQQFRDSIKSFSDFLGIFDDKDTKNLSKSIGIIITRVDNDGDTDETVKKNLKTQLLGILEDEKKSNGFRNINEELIFSEILSNNQLEIFSNPKKLVILDGTQSLNIRQLIYKLEYINKKDAKIRVRIENSYLPMLLTYTTDHYRKFFDSINEIINKSIINYEKQVNIGLKLDNFSIIYYKLNSLHNDGITKNNFKNFIDDIDEEILNKNEKEKIFLKNNLLNFLINIMPDENRKVFLFDQNWIKNNLKEKLKYLINLLIKEFQKEYHKLVKHIEEIISKALIKYFSIENLNTFENVIDAYLMLFKLQANRDIHNDSKLLIMAIKPSILSSNVSDYLLNQKDKVDDFLKMLSYEYKEYLLSEEKLMIMNLTNIIKQCSNELVKQIKNEFSNFEMQIESNLSLGFKKYFQDEIDKSIYIEDIKKIEKTIIDFRNSSKLVDIEGFINVIDKKVISEEEKINFLLKKSKFDPLKTLEIDVFKNIFCKKNWISASLDFELTSLMDELKKFLLEKEPVHNETTFTYKCYFDRLSSVSAKIRNHENIKNLKIVRIYSTHAFIIDENYKINSSKYLTHNPDLVIISPIVILEKQVTIDLSCSHIPDYPDQTVKAKNGQEYGSNGYDGKPGLPGYNGGNLIILSDTIINRSFLNFTSNGGKGGPGQNGGDGLDGAQGRNASYSEVKCSLTKKKDDCLPYDDTTHIKTNVDIDNFMRLIKRIELEKEGLSGDRGGNSGQGGRGGIGGYGGKSILIEKNQMKQYQDQTRTTGDDGISGNPGLGGSYGYSVRRTFLINRPKILGSVFTLGISHASQKIDFISDYDQIILSNRRAESGTKSEGLNFEGLIEPVELSEFVFYDKEIEYIRFIVDLNNEFKNTNLLHRNFIKNLIAETNFTLEIKISST